MNAWVFRHIDELQRIYAGPAAGVAVRPRPESTVADCADQAAEPARGPARGLAPSPAPDAAGPFSDGSPEAHAGAVPIPPGAVLRQETDEGTDVLMMPFRAPGSRHRRRRLS